MKTGQGTPWGRAQTVEPLAGIDGIERVYTAGHGGYYLNQERWGELRALLPDFVSFAGDQWLEEDCDWAICVLCWPELFTDADCYNAFRTAKHRKDLGDYWRIHIGVESRANVYEESIADSWEVGSMGSSGKGWTVSFSKVSDRDVTRSVHMTNSPRKQFYTTKELDDIEHTMAMLH